MKKLLYILIVALLMAGCRTEIEYKGEGAEPALYVYALFDSDTLNYVFVGQTSFFLEDRDDSCLDDAEVTLSVNGGTVVRLDYDRDTALYVCDVRFTEGDTLLLRVNHARLGQAEAKAVVPPKIDMTVDDVQFGVEDKIYDSRATLYFSVNDYKKMNNYYFELIPYVSFRAEYYYSDEEIYWDTLTDFRCVYSYGSDFIAAPESEENVDIWNMIFGDSEYDFKKFDMKANRVKSVIEFEYSRYLYYCDSLVVDSFYVDMDVYPSDYVEFVRQRDKAKYESMNPFVEPTQVQGNVKPLGDKNAFGFFTITRQCSSSLVL